MSGKHWWWDGDLRMLSFRGFIACFAAVVVVIVVVVVCIDYVVSSRNCAYASRQFHRSTHYDYLAGCYIDVGGQRVPLDSFRAFRGVR